MRPILLLLLFLSPRAFAAEPEFPLTEDSKVHDGVPHGELIKGSYTAKDGSVFPGTEREYTIYLPAGFDKANASSRSAPFMIFQDGVIYNAPVVFDNLIAKGQIPPLIGLFIKPGVVPAANANALPRYNRSYEYDSVTDTYSRFLLEEFLPALEAKHHLKLSTDPNDAAIAGNSSGGICAFMAAWHRPDRIRRIFSGVGTYVGIHGADQLPVLVRKYEPKPLRIYLQSGSGDNNLYCGDWWMANQTMERALTWAGYDVNHTWGEGGHNAKHASQIFPDVLRWLWRDYATAKEIKPNPRGESKWKGYEVLEADRDWQCAAEVTQALSGLSSYKERPPEAHSSYSWEHLAANKEGEVFASEPLSGSIIKLRLDGKTSIYAQDLFAVKGMAVSPEGHILACINNYSGENEYVSSFVALSEGKRKMIASRDMLPDQPCFKADGTCFIASGTVRVVKKPGEELAPGIFTFDPSGKHELLLEKRFVDRIALSPDQSLLYTAEENHNVVDSIRLEPNGLVSAVQEFYLLENAESYVPTDRASRQTGGLCVDTNGWLYVATALGIQVCDQAGRVNFIIPTPQPPHDVCFGGKDLGELFIACGDKIYQRPTKAHGIVSGQMPPIKPPPPKL